VTSVVTIGNFDGVHRGHLALIERTTSEATQRGARAVALTFDPHPATVVRPDAVPAALQSLEERAALLRAAGCDEVVIVPFDAAFAAQAPEEFVDRLLVDRLAAELVVVGTNFRFGRSAVGDVALLTTLGEQRGFHVEAVGLIDLGDGPVSSSALRSQLAAGDVEVVARGLGRPFSLTGEVVHGEGRGRTIGIPTANVTVAAGRALPADGVYACLASAVGLDRVPAVVNVGWRPTFAGTSRSVEAHLLVDDGPDLYGRRLTLEFIGRIRGEQRFDGPEALVARIHEDIGVARGMLSGT
jgi:riboflavin kinase / FMN adenylyltransferase